MSKQNSKNYRVSCGTNMFVIYSWEISYLARIANNECMYKDDFVVVVLILDIISAVVTLNQSSNCNEQSYFINPYSGMRYTWNLYGVTRYIEGVGGRGNNFQRSIFSDLSNFFKDSTVYIQTNIRGTFNPLSIYRRCLSYTQNLLGEINRKQSALSSENLQSADRVV